MDVQSAANLNIPEGSVRNIHDKDKRLLWSAVGYNVRYDGDTTQQTYSGKNKMPMQSADLTDSRSELFTIALPAGTYTYSFDLDSFELGTNSSFTIYSEIYLSTGTYADNNISGTITSDTALGRKSYTFTINADAIIALNHKSDIRIPQTYYDNGARASLSNIMIEPGSTATTYEPYVGGIPAPNPDYPQDIHVVKGAQSVKITGRNILPNNITTQTFHGVDITRNSDNSLTLNGTVDLGSYNFYLNIGQLNVKKDVTYTISGLSGWSYNTLQIYTPSSVAFPSGNRLSCSSGPTTVTAMGDEVVNVNLYFYEGQVYENVTVYPMVEVGDSVSVYEPYQGQTFSVGLGSIELCKLGNYQDYIFKSSGKNLWGGYTQYDRNNNGIIFSTLSNGNITAQGIASAQAYSVLGSQIIPNNVYITLGAGTYYLSTPEPVPTGVSVQIVNEAGGNIKTDVGSFTLSAPTPLACRLSITSGTNISGGITVRPMIEKSPTATPYEPYGTDWYVHKDTDKVILDGTGTWNSYTYHPAEYTYMHNVDGARSGYRTSICSHFTNVDGAWQEGVGQPGYYSDHPTLGRKYFVSDKTTVSDFTTWLSNHNVLLRFALETPTDTKITDSTLVAQLDAIHDWLTRYDYYGIVTGDLPIVINRVLLT